MEPVRTVWVTSSMCVDSWGHISFARALIEVCTDSVLKKEVIMAIENEEGDEYTREVIQVEYEWQPPHCVTCKCFGHDPNSCPKREKVDVSKAPPRPTTSSSAMDKEDGFVVMTSRKKKKKKKTCPNHVSGINLSKCNPNLKYRPVPQPGKGKGKASNEDNGPKKGSVNDNGSDNPSHIDEIVSTKNSFANLMEEDSTLTGQNVSSFVSADGNDGTKDGTSVVNVAAKSQEQGSLWEKFKASKEVSTCKPKLASLEDETDDDEVYMPNSHGGGFMDGLEDDLDCYDVYGNLVYDLTSQEQAFYDQDDIRL